MEVLKRLKNGFFYSKRKVWPIPEKTSTLEAPYEKNSLLSLSLKFWQFLHFSAWCILSSKNRWFSGWASAAICFCREILGGCSFFQEFAKLSVSNKRRQPSLQTFLTYRKGWKSIPRLVSLFSSLLTRLWSLCSKFLLTIDEFICGVIFKSFDGEHSLQSELNYERKL